jgi:hypothetical protein
LGGRFVVEGTDAAASISDSAVLASVSSAFLNIVTPTASCGPAAADRLVDKLEIPLTLIIPPHYNFLTT